MHSEDTAMPGFRTIPMGDLELLSEIQLNDETGLVRRQPGRNSVTRLLIGPLSRRTYSARVNGRNSDMTVAVYQGQNAEEEWRQDVSKYSGVRHPKFLQVYGVSGSSNLYATVFHEDLIPVQEIYWMCRRSTLATGYLDAYFGLELADAEIYIHLISGTYLHHGSYTPWMRRSTGRLCVDLSPSTIERPIVPIILPAGVPHVAIPPLPRDQDAAVIEALTLRQHQEIISHSHSIRLWSSEAQFVKKQMNLGALIYRRSLSKDPVELAAISTGQYEDSGWKLRIRGSLIPSNPMLMKNNWTRFLYSHVITTGTALREIHWPDAASCWLPQANYILKGLGITSEYEQYRIVYGIDYHISFSNTSRISPVHGYLFLSPLGQNFAAYWSFDPAGIKRLSHRKSASLGFPSLVLKVKIWSRSWDESVYAGLRQFHGGKGFNPFSQDVARQMGVPLYESAWINDNTMDVATVEHLADQVEYSTSFTPNHEVATPASRTPDLEINDTCCLPNCESFSTPEKVEPRASLISKSGILIQPRTFWILGPSALLCLLILLCGSLLHVSHGDQSVISLAIQRAERLESWLSDDGLINFLDLLQKDVHAAAVYNAIERDGIRVKWVQRQLGVQEET
ncbi:hypothetical protein B0H19DRAFT_141744 [Mycena capillaripes]|nr:hypothetical protein B0H19DRAFT_141744 [Mycena capillaripes]